MNLTRSLASIAMALLLSSMASAELITEWNYNAFSSPSSASTGVGETVGSSFGFTSSLPNNSGSPNDPGTAISDGNGTPLGINNYNATRSTPAPGAPSGDRKIDFITSTEGYSDISVMWDMTAGYRSSRYFQISATTDGTTFLPVSGGAGMATSNPSVGSATVDTFGLVTVTYNDQYIPDPDLDNAVDYLLDLSYTFPTGSAFEDNPNFAVRIAAIHSPSGNDFVSSFAGTTAADTVSGYTNSTAGGGGSTRYDLVRVAGTAVPEPTGLALIGCGLALLVGLRRRK